MRTPEKIVHKMYTNDAFSQWLGIEIVRVNDGFCEVKMNVKSGKEEYGGLAPLGRGSI